MSEPSKFSKPVWARIRFCPAGIVCAFQRPKWLEPMSTVTSTPLSAVVPLFVIITALVSQPPLELSGVPTKTAPAEPCHGLGLVCGKLSWCVS